MSFSLAHRLQVPFEGVVSSSVNSMLTLCAVAAPAGKGWGNDGWLPNMNNATATAEVATTTNGGGGAAADCGITWAP